MRIGVGSIIFGFLVACTVSSAVLGDIGPDTIANAEKCVVRIEVHSGDGESLGSGFVVSGDGIIVTNSHVISGAQSAVAHFSNGYKQDIIATRLIDPNRDIAIAKIDGFGLQAIPLASSNPRKGETVMALGAPHGLSFTATRGIVSAIRPEAEMVQELGDKNIKGTWIQVDAALSPGNSGGPLINEKGEVVAMSTLASSGSAQNLNFGIGVKDISDAYASSHGQPWVPLKSGAAKVVHPSRSGGDGGGGKHTEIPEQAIRAYIEEIKQDVKQYTRYMAQELVRLKADLKEMKAGSTDMPAEIAAKPDVDVAITKPTRSKGSKRYYFRSDRVKTREVSRVDSVVRSLTSAIERTKGSDPDAALLAVLEHGGPPLEPRKGGSIGFMKDATAVAAIDKTVSSLI